MTGPGRGTQEARRARAAGAALALLWSLTAILSVAGAAAGTRVRAPSIRDSPGWYPPADPESLADRIGRRLDAPVVRARFTGGCRSLDELGRAVLWALHHADADSLRSLCVTREEFSDVMWREFPQSRPATGLTADDAWGALARRFSAGVHGAVVEHAGRPLRFRRIERTDSTRHYRNFRLHNGVIIVAVNERGEEERLRFVRAAAERQGRFKIQSTTD